MAIGRRIAFFRRMRGLTQRYLGTSIGFPENSADVRIAQYEREHRIPKSDITLAIARTLDVDISALTVPDIDSYTGIMHTLFAMEDMYGLHLHVDKTDGTVCLKFDPEENLDADVLNRMLCSWNKIWTQYQAKEIDKETYDRWRYHFPKYDEDKVTTYALDMRRKLFPVDHFLDVE